VTARKADAELQKYPRDRQWRQPPCVFPEPCPNLARCRDEQMACYAYRVYTYDIKDNRRHKAEQAGERRVPDRIPSRYMFKLIFNEEQ
jgi:hypothetical protein